MKPALERFLAVMDREYPDGVIIADTWDHSRWDRAASMLCKYLGYDTYDAEGYRRLFPGMIYRLPKTPEGYHPRQNSDNLVPADGVSVSEILDSFYSAKEKEAVYQRKSRELRTVPDGLCACYIAQ